jgi:Uma2 family endonuclease
MLGMYNAATAGRALASINGAMLLGESFMPTFVAEPVYIASPTDRSRKRWTRDELKALERSGLLADQHLELIAGELLNKMGKNRPHVNATSKLRLWMERVFGAEFVACEAPIEVDPGDQPLSEPEPDLIALKQSSDPFSLTTPPASDLALVVEVSDTSLTIDLTIKAPLYARAGVLDYWVVDVNGKRLIVHRQPEEGRYKSVAAYSVDEQVAPLAAPRESSESGVWPLTVSAFSLSWSGRSTCRPMR